MNQKEKLQSVVKDRVSAPVTHVSPLHLFFVFKDDKVDETATLEKVRASIQTYESNRRANQTAIKAAVESVFARFNCTLARAQLDAYVLFELAQSDPEILKNPNGITLVSARVSDFLKGNSEYDSVRGPGGGTFRKPTESANKAAE